LKPNVAPSEVSSQVAQLEDNIKQRDAQITFTTHVDTIFRHGSSAKA
jgi:hypothetical protein